MILFWLLFIFIQISLIKTTSAIRTINCNSNMTKLAVDEYILFQTPDYPKVYLTGKYNRTSCKNNFIRSDGNSNLWFIFLNGFVTNFDLTEVELKKESYEDGNFAWEKMPPWFSYLTISSNLIFNQLEIDVDTYFNDYSGWSGFQALIYAPDILNNQNCPFSGKTFTLSDNTEIIPIVSSFYFPYINPEILPGSSNCLWNFIIPEGYKLKIHIKQITFLNDYSLSLKADHNGSITIFNSAGEYYFEGSSFTIFYNQKSQKVSSNYYGFGGTVSMVKSNPNIIKSCFNYGNKFGNLNSTFGYEVDSVCQKQIIVSKGQTLFLTYHGYLEDGVDTLIATDIYKNRVDITQVKEWLIDANITLEFKSDGSIIQGGFTVTTLNHSCKCWDSASTSITGCDEKDITRMEGFGMVKDSNIWDSYCGNMKCMKKLLNSKKCLNYSFILIPDFRPRAFSNDTFKLLLNEKIIDEKNVNSQTINHFIFDPTNEVTIDFQTDPTLFGIYPTPRILFETLSLKDINIQVINLAEKEYTFSIALFEKSKTLDLITVNAPIGYTLDFYMADNNWNYDTSLKNSYLYDSNSTKNMISRLSELPLHPKYQRLKHYTSISRSLTMLLYYDSYPTATILFRLREIHAKNCPSSDNVITSLDTPISTTALATGPCYITILYCNYVEYNSITTNAKENVKLMKGVVVDQAHEIVEFNSDTVSKWKKLLLFNIVNSFLIPTNSTLNFATVLEPNERQYQNMERGIISSYVAPDTFNASQIFSMRVEIELPMNKTCKMTAKYLDISPNVTIVAYRGLIGGITSFNITQINETVSVSNPWDYNTELIIIYPEINLSRQGYVIEFEIVPNKSSNSNICLLLLFIIYILNIYCLLK